METFLLTIFSLGAPQFAVVLSLVKVFTLLPLSNHKLDARRYLPLEFRYNLQVADLLLGKIQGKERLMQEMGSRLTQWGLKASSINGRST